MPRAQKVFPCVILSTRAIGSSALLCNTSISILKTKKLQSHCANRLEYKVPYVSK